MARERPRPSGAHRQARPARARRRQPLSYYVLIAISVVVAVSMIVPTCNAPLTP